MGGRRRSAHGRDRELNRAGPIARGALLAAMIWAVLSALGVLLPRAPIAQALAQAYSAGALIHTESAVGDRRRGASQFNDCIILATGYFRAGNLAQDLVSPARPILESGSVKDACGSLHRALAGLTHTFDFDRYHRYLFGQRGLVAAYLQFGSLDSLRGLLLLLTHATAVGLLAAGGLRRWRMSKLPAQEVRTAHVTSIALMLSGGLLLLFFGLRDFGQSVAHAPADLASMSLLAFVLSRDLFARDRRASTLKVLALFGGLTAVFELLIGSLPIGAAAILMGYGLQSATTNLPARERVREAAWGVIAFLGAFGAMFATKLVSAAIVFGPGVLQDFYANLMIRAGAGDVTANVSRVDLTLAALEGLRGSVTTLFWEQAWLAYVAVASSALAIVLAFRHAQTTTAVLFSLAIAAVPAWYVLFPEHTLRHGWFMARILIWPMLAASLFFVATHVGRVPHPEGRTSRPALRTRTRSRRYPLMDLPR